MTNNKIEVGMLVRFIIHKPFDKPFENHRNITGLVVDIRQGRYGTHTVYTLADGRIYTHPAAVLKIVQR